MLRTWEKEEEEQCMSGRRQECQWSCRSTTPWWAMVWRSQLSKCLKYASGGAATATNQACRDGARARNGGDGGARQVCFQRIFDGSVVAVLQGSLGVLRDGVVDHEIKARDWVNGEVDVRASLRGWKWNGGGASCSGRVELREGWTCTRPRRQARRQQPQRSQRLGPASN